MNMNKLFLIPRRSVGKPLGRRSCCSSLYSSEEVLSKANMKRTMAKFAAMKPVRLQPHQPAKKAAVLVPLCLVDNQVSLLYTLRASKLKSHGGQVSFPGGMQDVKDTSLEVTALRETKEELGINADEIELWGRGSMIVTRGDMCVLPIVGRIKQPLEIEKLKVNPGEVREVFTVSLEDLCDSANIAHTQFRGAYSAPVFLGGLRRVWGLTAIITNLFLKSLLSQAAYHHEIKYIPSVKLNRPVLPGQ